LKLYKADMHIHSCLSPCGDWEMSPKAIVEKSREIELDIIAICDHNSVENAGAAITVGRIAGVTVLPGMEVCSKEEVHVVTLFETLEQALEMQEIVYENLPGENDTNLWGDQIVANENNEVIYENVQLLIGATTLSLYEIVKKVHALDGICIASHIDRPAFGLISNLGFIPPDLNFDGLEISYRMEIKTARETIPGIDKYSCVTSSDAHYLHDIGKVWTGFFIKSPTFNEIRLALHNLEGRRLAD